MQQTTLIVSESGDQLAIVMQGQSLSAVLAFPGQAGFATQSQASSLVALVAAPEQAGLAIAGTIGAPLAVLADGSSQQVLAIVQGGDGPVARSALQPATGMSVVIHGEDPNAPRPLGAAAVYWIGSAEPVNAQDGDLW